MRKLLIKNLEEEGPGDIVGAVAGETSHGPEVLGEIDIRGSTAEVEVEEEAIGEIISELDGGKIGRSEVEVEKLEGEKAEKMDSLESYINEYKELVEMERREEMRQHEQEIQNLSGREREQKGRALLHLRTRDEGEGIEGHRIKFMRNRKGEELPETEIGVGDLVMISKKDPLRDDNPTGTVIEKTNYSITVAFDERPQGFVYRAKGLRMDLYVNDITYQRMKEALEKMRELEGEKAELRDVIIGEKEPEPDRKKVKKWRDEKLNQSQKKAVEKALGAEDFHLIHGPPGTGKTTTAIEVIRQYIDEGKTVLATADSKAAVDNMLEFLLEQGVDAVRVGHPARVAPKLRQNTLDALVEKNEKYQESREIREKAFELKDRQEDLTHPSGRWRRGMSDERIKELAEQGKGSRGVPQEKIEEMGEWLELQDEIDELFEKSDRLEDEAVEEIIESMEVVCATNSTSGSELMEGKEFDVVVIDEATQSTEPSCLIPITYGREVIMAGDHRQLPPTVKNLDAEGLEHTLFERLAEKHPEIKSLLRKQYRMHERIMEFSSEEFYEGKLEAHESVRRHTLSDLEFDTSKIEDRSETLDPEEPVVFVDTAEIDAGERTPPGSTSKENRREAEIMKQMVEKAIEAGLEEEEIAVISPYDDQVDLLGKKLDREDLEVKTVDGFQGREKEAVFISLVRSNDRGEIGFLKDYRRLNVALTRAKRKLVVIGDSDTLESDKVYRSFLDYVGSNGKNTSL
ncbi:MAG: IGHMBP2 family helicase [Candidatus Nanohaloarchaea archaeon]